VALVFGVRPFVIGSRHHEDVTKCCTANQQEMLSRAGVFVTHGGSNSLHEAVLSKVPMVVAPFFGDQMLISHRVEDLGIGIPLSVPQTTGKHGPKHYLGDGPAERMDDAVRRILADDTYRRRYAAIPLESTPPLRGLETMVYNDA
jgi:UDP:flavonoid glycosyltransferase YjiC (YdhE family)